MKGFASVLLWIAIAMQAVAVIYGIRLMVRHRTASWAPWLFLLGAMTAMLAWRVVVVSPIEPPPFFNPLIAIWGSTCMLTAMFFFSREVRRRTAAEAERDALLTSERAARAEAERANRLKDDFLATLSHELRTPLTAILGWCAVVREAGERRADVARAIETIERNARVQARLVDDLLDVTRIHAGSLHLDGGPVALVNPVRGAVQAILPMAAAKSITVDLRCDAFPTVVGDAGRLQQVLSNLLSNAVKFTPNGGAVQVAVESAGAFARVSVTDNGEGIDPAFLPHVFRRFLQASSGSARRHGGLGLGLAITESLVRLHGGNVRAWSEGVGRGSVFTVELPSHASDASEVADAGEAQAPAEPSWSLRGIRVLLVDDEPDVRAAVRRILEQMGAEVAALVSGGDVERALPEFRPDVMLLDIGMPDEDGYALLRRIRGLGPAAGGSTPAISLTAHARDEDRNRAVAAGFQEHLPKPVDVPRLVAAIRAVIGARAEPTPDA